MQELRPDGLRLPVADHQPEDLVVTSSGDPGGDDHGLGRRSGGSPWPCEGDLSWLPVHEIISLPGSRPPPVPPGRGCGRGRWTSCSRARGLGRSHRRRTGSSRTRSRSSAYPCPSGSEVRRPCPPQAEQSPPEVFRTPTPSFLNSIAEANLSSLRGCGAFRARSLTSGGRPKNRSSNACLLLAAGDQEQAAGVSRDVPFAARHLSRSHPVHSGFPIRWPWTPGLPWSPEKAGARSPGPRPPSGRSATP